MREAQDAGLRLATPRQRWLTGRQVTGYPPGRRYQVEIVEIFGAAPAEGCSWPATPGRAGLPAVAGVQGFWKSESGNPG
jgi:hypothetical protein